MCRTWELRVCAPTIASTFWQLRLLHNAQFDTLCVMFWNFVPNAFQSDLQLHRSVFVQISICSQTMLLQVLQALSWLLTAGFAPVSVIGFTRTKQSWTGCGCFFIADSTQCRILLYFPLSVVVRPSSKLFSIIWWFRAWKPFSESK